MPSPSLSSCFSNRFLEISTVSYENEVCLLFSFVNLRRMMRRWNHREVSIVTLFETKLYRDSDTGRIEVIGNAICWPIHILIALWAQRNRTHLCVDCGICVVYFPFAIFYSWYVVWLKCSVAAAAVAATHLFSANDTFDFCFYRLSFSRCPYRFHTRMAACIDSDWRNNYVIQYLIYVLCCYFI